MSIKRYNPTFRQRDDVFDNITPYNVVQATISNPAGEWKPAAWLPVAWYETANQDWFVISSGKVLAMDSTNRIVPAGLRLYTDASANMFRYGEHDVSARTEDIRTGLPVTATSVVTLEEFCTAVLERGWVAEDDVSLSNTVAFDAANSASEDDADAQAILKAFISSPVGIADYNVFSWAGDQPSKYKFHNYQKQHLIQFVTEMQMKMPQMALSAEETASLNGITEYAAASHGAMPSGASPLWMDNAALEGMLRYSLENDDVLYIAPSSNVAGIYLGANEVVPEINAMTAADVSTMLAPSGAVAIAALANRKSRAKDVRSDGDYFLDAKSGIVIVHSTYNQLTGTAFTGADEIDFFIYSGAQSEAHQHIYFVGDCRPGDFVTFDKESNMQRIDSMQTVSLSHTIAENDLDISDSALGASTHPAYDIDFSFQVPVDPALIIGRVHEIQQFPKSLMDRVTTAWQGTSFGANSRMPGTATEGLPDNLSLAGQNNEVVGNRMVIVTVRI